MWAAFTAKAIALWDLIKSVFGGKAAIQLGNSNRHISGITTTGTQGPQFFGDNNQLNVHQVSPRESYQDLESLMPEVFAALRADLAGRPSVRDICWQSNAECHVGGAYVRLSFDDFPTLEAMMTEFEQRGLVKPNGSHRWIMSESFARRLIATAKKPWWEEYPRAAVLLAEVAKSRDKTLSATQYGGGFDVSANDKTFGNPEDEDSVAPWKEAVEDLEKLGYTKKYGTTDNMFEITRAGREVAKQIPADFLNQHRDTA